MADSDATSVVVGATETTQVTQTTATTVKQEWWGSLTDRLDPGVLIGLVAFVLTIVALMMALRSGSNLLAQLQEQAFARGLITFIFTVGTLAIAITLVGSALFSDA